MNLKDTVKADPVYGVAIFAGAACAVKSPPIGRRGSDSNVRAASFGGAEFSWEAYIAKRKADTMVIPMDEDYAFTDNSEETVAVVRAEGSR